MILSRSAASVGRPEEKHPSRNRKQESCGAGKCLNTITVKMVFGIKTVPADVWYKVCVCVFVLVKTGEQKKTSRLCLCACVRSFARLRAVCLNLCNVDVNIVKSWTMRVYHNRLVYINVTCTFKYPDKEIQS